MALPIKWMIKYNEENEKKVPSCLKNQTEKTEWNEDMNL